MNDFDDDELDDQVNQPPPKIPSNPASQKLNPQRTVALSDNLPGTNTNPKLNPQENVAYPNIFPGISPNPKHPPLSSLEKFQSNPLTSIYQNKSDQNNLTQDLNPIIHQRLLSHNEIQGNSALNNKKVPSGLEFLQSAPFLAQNSGQNKPSLSNVLQNTGKSCQDFSKLSENKSNLNESIAKLSIISNPQVKLESKPQPVPDLASNPQLLNQKSPLIPANPAPLISAVNIVQSDNLKFDYKPAADSEGLSKLNSCEKLEVTYKVDLMCKDMIMIMQESIVCNKVLQFYKLFDYLEICKNNEEVEELICVLCGKFYMKMQLKCKHSICVYCFNAKIEDFLRNPVLENIGGIRCWDCRVIFSIVDVERFFGQGSEQSTKFTQLYIPKKCIWCKRKQNLLNCYLGELECLHLCSQCYLTQVYYGNKSCFGCGIDFNLEFTLNRESTCMKCKNTGEIVSEGFRSLHEDHELCYNCINRILSENKKFDVCPVCDKSLNKVDEVVLAYFFNKNCLYCDQVYPASNLIVCKQCQHIICEFCNATGSYFHNCFS